MPALARKTAPDHYNHRTTVSARPASTRGVERTSRQKTASAAPARRSTPAAAPDEADVRELLSHFGHGNIEKETKVRAQLEARREAKRRARRRHRPFRMTLTAGVLAAAPLGLLACLLWLRSSALAMSRYDTQLQDKISTARFDLERTRKEIAALNASPHIEQWARERGWRQAGQSDFDQVPVVKPPEGQPADE